MTTNYVRKEYGAEYYRKIREALEEYEKAKNKTDYDVGRSLELKLFLSTGVKEIGFGRNVEKVNSRNTNFSRIEREARFLREQINKYIARYKENFEQDVANKVIERNSPKQGTLEFKDAIPIKDSFPLQDQHKPSRNFYIDS